METWATISRGNFNFSDMCLEITKFIEKDKTAQYEICIGTDSQRHSMEIKFVTAILVHKIGNGGQYYWLSKKIKYINSLKQKIMQEVSLTYQYKEMLKKGLEKTLNEYNITIVPHLDIGSNGKTKIYITEALGIFKGFSEKENALIKPNSFAASCVANRHTK